MPCAFMQGIRIAHILSVNSTKAVVGLLFSISTDILKLVKSELFPHSLWGFRTKILLFFFIENIN